MKIAIIHIPRCGSTSLATALGNALDLRVFYEPFKPNANTLPYDFNIDHVLKTMVFHIDPDTFNFKGYDKVIYLTRRNLIEASQSWDYQMQNNRGNWKGWNTPYTLEKSEIPGNGYEFLKHSDYQVKEIADKVVYYEDIYSKDRDRVFKVFENLNITENFDKLFSLLTSKNRYRNYGKNLI